MPNPAHGFEDYFVNAELEGLDFPLASPVRICYYYIVEIIWHTGLPYCARVKPHKF